MLCIIINVVSKSKSALLCLSSIIPVVNFFIYNKQACCSCPGGEVTTATPLLNPGGAALEDKQVVEDDGQCHARCSWFSLKDLLKHVFVYI